MSCFTQWDTISVEYHSSCLRLSNHIPYSIVQVIVSLSSLLKSLGPFHNWNATPSRHRSKLKSTMKFLNSNLPSFFFRHLYLYSQYSYILPLFFSPMIYHLSYVFRQVFCRSIIDKTFLPDMISHLTLIPPEMGKRICTDGQKTESHNVFVTSSMP